MPETLDQGPVMALLISSGDLSRVLTEHNKEADAIEKDCIEILTLRLLFAPEIWSNDRLPWSLSIEINNASSSHLALSEFLDSLWQILNAELLVSRL